MVKEPRVARVKTRLARGIGAVPAAWWYRHQCRRLFRRLLDPRWELWIAVSPDREGLNSRVWPKHLPRMAQGRGDLGDRMVRILRRDPPGPVVIIGSDVPGVRPAHIHQAIRALGASDVVIGPSGDGGFWLIGCQGPRPLPPNALKPVRWSGPHARADTLASLAGCRVAEAATLDDVDDAADLT